MPTTSVGLPAVFIWAMHADRKFKHTNVTNSTVAMRSDPRAPLISSLMKPARLSAEPCNAKRCPVLRLTRGMSRREGIYAPFRSC